MPLYMYTPLLAQTWHADLFCLTLTLCITRKSWQIGSGRSEQVVLEGRPVEVLGPFPFELRYCLVVLQGWHLSLPSETQVFLIQE